MTKTVYLRNGEAVELHDTITDGQYIIERLFYYEGYDSSISCDPNGIREVVSEIFMKPPLEKRHEELNDIIERTEIKKKELQEIESRIRNAKIELLETEKQKTDIEKHIINRSELLNAKTITVFDGYKPQTLTEQSEKKSLYLTYSISVYDGKFNGWIYELDYEGRKGHNRYINLEHGILIDATEDEILEIGKQIVKNKKEISDYDLKRVDILPDEYLTDELKQRRFELVNQDKLNVIEKQKNRIKEEQEKLQKLKEKLWQI